jgi:hypothetical protein
MDAEEFYDNHKEEERGMDWDKLREKYFEECTEKDNTGIPRVNLHPHNLFEWFKRNISDHFVDVNNMVTDEEIEREAQQRYGEVTGGQYHADRPYNRKCFRWMREKLNK